MSASSRLKFENQLFSGEQIDEVALIKLKADLLLKSSDLNIRDEFFEFINRVSANDEISVVLILGFPEKTGVVEYDQFYDRVKKTGLSIKNLEKLYNSVNQFIMKIMGLNKFVIHADSGKVISVFLNVSLACDYRIIGDNTVFIKPYHRYGLVPKGGGAYFISRLLGRAAASELLYSDKNILAEQAKRIGLVDEVVPAETIEAYALNIAKEYTKLPYTTLVGIKKLLNYQMKDLENYLNYENEVLRRIIRSADMQNL